jgi:ParB family transcriptional regulator, chromosome partitioning protein
MVKELDYNVKQLPMKEVFSDAEFNCRGKIVPIDVLDLAKSIEAEGLQQPIVVQPYTSTTNPDLKYRIVAGHRRHLACKVNKMETIPAMIREGLTELEARLFNLTENLKREDLNILQEARALVPFKKGGWSEDFIAAKTGMSRGWVQVRKMLLDLPEDIQIEAAAGLLTQAQIRELSSMKSDDDRYAAVRLIKERREKGESVKDIGPKKPAKPHEKKERSGVEMSELQDYIQEEVGNSIVTRMLGWCTGYVSNYEIHRDLREWYKAQGKSYRIPREIAENI